LLTQVAAPPQKRNLTGFEGFSGWTFLSSY
jgi:hypothetical protein